MSETTQMFGNRAKCEVGGCIFLGKLAAAGVYIERAIEAGRQAAVLPHEWCRDGLMTSVKDGIQFCGMRHEVQTGALAVAAYAEASAAPWPEGATTQIIPLSEIALLNEPVLEQQP